MRDAMKILWVINSMVDEIANESGRKAGFGGGWIPAMSERLREKENVELSIVVFGKKKEYKIVKKNRITYHIFPLIKGLYKNGGGKKAVEIWNKIIQKSSPDIIHIYGTEQPTPIELVRNYKNLPIIVSLQGILTEYYKHYYGNMELKDIWSNVTLVDILLGSSGFFGRKKFKKNVQYEKEILNSVDWVEGRTEWDYCVSKSINPNLKYYECSRMLRKEFYDTDKWNLNTQNRYSIFVHQGNYSIKGLHMLVKAIAVLKVKYPNLIVRIAGQDPTKKKGIKGKLSVNGYSKYVKKLAEQLGVYENLQYEGALKAAQVVERLKICNVMVIPSAIENSPNSLAEAMMIGVPCVASFVGGNAEMLEYGLLGQLYPYNDPIMLANAIDRVFSEDKSIIEMSKKAIDTATKRHNPEKLVKKLLSIYSDMLMQ